MIIMGMMLFRSSSGRAISIAATTSRVCECANYLVLAHFA